MAKENLIRKKAIEILEKEKWLIWWPSRAIFKQNDIFGLFDLICLKKKVGNLKFVQLTTLSNLSTRKKKIRAFFKKNKINPAKKVFGAEVEVWAYDERHKKFKTEVV